MGDGPNSKEERVPGKEWRHDEPSLAEDDKKEDSIDPDAVRDHELGEFHVEVEEVIEKFFHVVSIEKRGKSARQ